MSTPPHNDASAERKSIFTSGPSAENRPAMSEEGSESAAPPAMPGWAWIFIVACGIIPLFAIGLLTLAIAAGGVCGCMAVSRRSWPALARVGLCLAITVACWAGSIVVVIVAAWGMGRL
ncbi:MAG: hypothetical protein HYS13_01450 [Planctomycetia bacterium]|nr:hypothetical protein [Planctomycetia bacterium]